ncbi:MAG: histidine kinase [Collimonas sp.]|uniref:sensor histidine kinase n=1 Tax=Collimonas sp. TaxID=1963772 RepID=UPI0032648666
MNRIPELALQQNAGPLGQRLLKSLLINLSVDIGCAVFVTYVMEIGDSFLQNLVFSLCIGLSVMLFNYLGRYLLWRNNVPPRRAYMALILATAGLAFLFGTRLATKLLCLPPDGVDQYMSYHATGLIVLTVSLSVGATLFFWNQSTLAELRNQAATEKARSTAVEKQALQAQLQLLQAQIEPHMLFNTLATLQSLIAFDAPRAQQMLDQLIQYLRSSLSSSRTGQTTLAQEFGLMEAYLELMSLRMGARLSYALDLPEALRSTVIAPMLLQPLVENAIKHGVEPKIEGGRIEVSASRYGQMLLLRVSDTGLGLADEETRNQHHQPGGNSSHIGLDNIRERLHALYGSEARLHLGANMPHGVIAQIQLPYLS